MAFDDVQFPTDISRGSKGGPRFNTSIVRINSGFEVRDAQWQDPLFEFNARYGVKRFNQLQAVHDFFLARLGQTFGFRYKNWLDFIALNQPTNVQITIDGDPNAVFTPRNGSRYLQLQRKYTSGPRSYTKNIVKPVLIPSVSVRLNTTSLTNPADFTVDNARGIIKLDLTQAFQNNLISTFSNTILPIPLTITTIGIHNLIVNDVIWIEGVSGAFGTTLNNRTWVIQTVPTTTTFTLNVNGDPAGSGGTIYQFFQTLNPAPGLGYDWSGEFDLPVRFATDVIDPTLDGPDIGSVPDIPIVETRDFL